jgi:hypothetical protein
MRRAPEVTCNVADAMWWIGDTDLRQAQKYLKKRDHQMRDIARGVSALTKNTGEKRPERLGANREGTATALKTQRRVGRLRRVNAFWHNDVHH